MGKAANAGGGAQAKATAKGKAAPEKAAAKVKDGGKPEKGKDAKDAKDAKADAAKSEAESAQAKLLEEAKQAFADDERNEKTRIELRDANREARAKGAQMNGNRDKGIARVTKFQNKLKLFKGDTELNSVMNDIDGVDASKYVSELAECIMEAAGVTLKLKELPSALRVCSRLHATYDEFGSSLQKALEKAYKATAASDLNRRRFLIRFCIDLVLVECMPKSNQPLLDMMKELSDISLPEEQVITNFTIIASVVQKHAVSCLNITPSKQKAYEEALKKPWVERKCCLDGPLQVQLSQLIIDAYQGSAVGLLTTAHSRLLEQEKVNQKLRIDKGQVDAENEQKHSTLKENFTKLQGNLATLSEYLNQPLPTPQEENPEATRLTTAAPDNAQATETQEEDLPMLWEDAEQQRFYEEILDCKDVIPAVLLGLDKGSTAAVSSADDAIEDRPAKDRKASGEDGEGKLTASDLDLYLMRVAQTEGPKQIDDMVQEFFHEHNTKGARRQLAHTLYDVQRAAPHLLAPRARFVATVAPYIKEVPPYVLEGLKRELEQLLAEKDPERLESKVKTVRYLCELAKFRVCPPGVILDAFKAFCDDFSLHHAELCANLLQCCGRFLLYSPETAQRTENLLERMMRLKNVKSLGVRLEIMLEDAYYTMKPPEGKRKQMRVKEPLELFTQDLIYNRLYTEEDDDKVLRLVRKLPWDGDAPKWVKKCILELNLHANYENIFQLASLLSGLAKYRDHFVIEVIDSLFENIQTSIERNDFREAPLRVRQVKLLGELYNYRLIDSNIVFDMMYHLIGFGGPTMHRAGAVVTPHKVLERASAARRAGLGSIAEEGAGDEDGVSQIPAVLADPQHPIEAPWDFFRIKLVCVMLETCGHYFDRGAIAKKLDRFLQFFMRYVLAKGELPLRMTYMVSDMIERLRPKMEFPEQLAEMDKKILKLMQAERENLDLSDGADFKEQVQDDAGSEDSSDEDESSEEEDSSDEDGESEESESESESESDDEGGEEPGTHRPRVRDEDYNRGMEATRRHVEEYDEFDKEMQQMLVESYEREKTLAPRQKSEMLAAPQAVKRPENAVPGMFSLMQKKSGGKVLLKQIDIPEDSKLARVVQSESDEASREKEELKRYIINYDQQQAAAAPVLGLGGNSRGITVQLRPGKGKVVKGAGSAGKGGGGPRRKGEEDYLKDEFLPDRPENDLPVASAMGQAPLLRAKGGSGGSSSRSMGKGGSSSGGMRGSSGSSGSGGGSQRSSGKGASGARPGGKGTPSQPQGRGSL